MPKRRQRNKGDINHFDLFCNNQFDIELFLQFVNKSANLVLYKMEDNDSCNDFPLCSRLDMDSDSDVATSTPAPNQYETIYVTSHKAPCRAGAFSPDGKLIATGSADASIKILDVDRMISKSTSHQANQAQSDNTHQDSSGQPDHLVNADSNNGHETVEHQQQPQQQHQPHHNTHPVIRTLYDHCEEVTFLQFHPSAPILASGSQDMTIKFYDYGRATAKRAHKTIQDASPIRCFTFHPSGNYMLVGCQQPTLRLYDINTMQSFVSSNPLDQHTEPITMIDYNKTASFYVSGCKNGDIKVWDGTSNRCVNTFRRAHDGAVSSLKVSRNGKYILSAGKDCHVKLWEMSMCSCLMTYDGATSSSSKNHRAQAVFNHTEEFVMFPDCRNMSLHGWNARTGKHLESLPLCHNNSVRFITHSSVSSAFLTCSEDFRARFWSIREKDVSNKSD